MKKVSIHVVVELLPISMVQTCLTQCLVIVVNEQTVENSPLDYKVKWFTLLIKRLVLLLSQTVLVNQFYDPLILWQRIIKFVVQVSVDLR